MRIALLILTSFFGLSSYAQECNADSLFSIFKKDIQIELQRYKHVKWDDETKESYYTFMGSCSIQSLVKYVEDPVPDVRCLVFAGLAQKNADTALLSEIIAKHKNDTAAYTYGSDAIITWTVRDFMQSALRLKSENKIPNAGADYGSLLKKLRSEFRVIIPGVFHGTASKDSLLAIDSLRCSFKEYKIVSFTLFDASRTMKTNNVFTDEIKEYVRNIKPGGYLYIDDMIVEDANNFKRRVASIILEMR